jgi:hypothetical protein
MADDICIDVILPKLGDKIDRMFDLREQKRLLTDQIKEIDEEYNEIRDALMGQMTELGTETARATLAQATLTQAVVPTVKDWDELYQYIKDNDALYLLERRPSVGAFRELFQGGEQIPGVEPYTKFDVSLRRNR